MKMETGEKSTIMMVDPSGKMVEVTQSKVVNDMALRDYHIKKALFDETSVIGTYFEVKDKDKYFQRVEDETKSNKNNEGGNSKRSKKAQSNAGTTDETRGTEPEV